VTNKKILIVIPCYNEEQNIERLNAQIKAVSVPGCDIVPLFINDCSKDGSLSVLKKIGVKYLSNPINLRIGGTVQTGFMYAFKKGYDAAVQMDGDGQHPPEELHKIIAPLIANEADVVIGSRFIDKEGFQSSAMRRFGIDFFSKLNKMLVGITIKDSTSGYRIYNRKALEELVKYYPDEYPEPEAIVYLANKKIRIKEVPVLMHERQAGVSSIGKFSSIYYMVKVSLNSIFLHLKMKLNG
jgi:glycosyltransferase involved in cell wall biosynthesis